MKFIISDTAKVKIFATIFRQLKNLVADVNINMYSDKMYIQGMGEAQACLFELLLQKDWFEEYEVDNPHAIGIHCETIFRMIGCLEDGQKITMYMKDTDDKLSVDFDTMSSDKKTIQKKFKMPLMTLDGENLTVPETEYEADIIMNSIQFAELVNQLNIFGEELQIICNMECIDLRTKGDHGQMTLSIKDDDIIEYAIEEDIIVNITCGLKFLQHMCSFSKISENVYIHCSGDTPIKLHYSLDDADSEKSNNYVRFFLAPKIED